MRAIPAWTWAAAALWAPLAAQENLNVLAVTASSGDYLWGAGGTLAQLALDGYQVYVAQFGNDEKAAGGLTPAEARWANVEEAQEAAELLGFRDTIYLAHKSGELGQVSSTEMREQLFALIRHLRPAKIFLPDPYLHFQPDWDLYWVGKMAEEAWGYSGGAMFSPQLARMGLLPYSVPEVYYYAAARPYRPGEGGEENARMVAVDIGRTLLAKTTALAMLRTRNRALALEAGLRFDPGDEGGPRRLAVALAEQLAREIGRRHGFEFAEEFNHVGRGDPIPPHVLERAVKK
jgi:LmbE family N-acetylglucosaminyl deacetylase